VNIRVGIFHSTTAAIGASKLLQKQGVATDYMRVVTREADGTALQTVSPEHAVGADSVRTAHLMGAVKALQ
jgi:hypothetical protein